MVWEELLTYRGILIWIWKPEANYFAIYLEAPLNDWFYFYTLNETVAMIDSYRLVTPEPDPTDTVFIENYRGVDIHQFVVSGWYTFTYDTVIYSFPNSLAEVRGYIDDILAAAEEPQFIETYKEVDIYWLPLLEVFRAQVAPGYLATSDTLPEIKIQIDDILAFLEEPEPSPGSILEQVLTQVMIWVGDSLDGWLQPLRDWVDASLAGARDAWENLVAGAVSMINSVSGALTNLGVELRDRWDTFNTLTLPSIWDTITNMFVGAINHIDTVNLNLRSFISNEFVDFAGWVEGLFAVLDPLGFLKDPLGYIKAAFDTLIEPWAGKLIESFLAGFEEGLEDG